MTKAPEEQVIFVQWQDLEQLLSIEEQGGETDLDLASLFEGAAVRARSTLICKHYGCARVLYRYARMNEHVPDLLSHDDDVPLYGAKMNGSETIFFKQLSQRTLSDRTMGLSEMLNVGGRRSGSETRELGKKESA
jgi:hypothetical protein